MLPFACVMCLCGVWLLALSGKSVAREDGVSFQALYDLAVLSDLAYQPPAKIKAKRRAVTWVETHAPTNMRYFVETKEATRTQTAVFRGSVDDVNFEFNFDTFAVTDSKTGLVVHRGFHEVARAIYPRLKRQLRQDYTIYLTGHSLGGTMAAMMGVYLQQDGFRVGGIYTFGQPKFTDMAGARSLAGLPLLRVIHQNDVAAFFPPKAKGNGPRYEHMGSIINLLKGPYYIFATETQVFKAPPQVVRNVRRQFSLPDHKMKFYLRNLGGKLEGAKRVAFRDRVKYIDRKRREPMRRTFNFGPHR